MAAPFPGTGKIWMNGSLVDWADAKIHIASHVIHYGSGVFEGARCYDTPRGSACFRLDAHLNRLFDSAKIYRMEPNLSYNDIHKAVIETIKANEFKACYIRPLVYRGYHTLGVNPFPCPVDTAIVLWEWGTYLGQDALTNGVDVRISY
jgi:branched-chain amino acid aminotransferase